MNISLRTAMLTLSVGFLLTPCATAGPITWTLQNVDFNYHGSGMISGSFVFDADTGLYSSIDLTTDIGTIGDPNDTPFLTESYQLKVAAGTGNDLTGDLGVDLYFSSGLTDAGGIVNLTYSASGFCADAACSAFNAPGPGTGDGLVGTVTAQTASAPEPASLLLIVSGMIFFTAMAVRRRSVK